MSSFALRFAVLALAITACAPDEAPAHPPEVPAAYLAKIRAEEGPIAPPAAATSAPITPLPLATCGDREVGFSGWLASFRAQAITEGISERTVASALGDVAYDPSVIALDRSQRAFHLTFEEFAAKHLKRALVQRGAELRREERATLAKIDHDFGVPPEILVAIWGLETSYGDDVGDRSALRSLATLAYDCRRSARFRGELMAALRIVERGDLTPGQMRGAWAGEIGQTQFLPSSYEQFATDFDGDGRADLIDSSADALASTARYLVGHGWRPHEGFRAGSANFAALASWNESEIYRKTIVRFAEKLGAR